MAMRTHQQQQRTKKSNHHKPRNDASSSALTTSQRIFPTATHDKINLQSMRPLTCLAVTFLGCWLVLLPDATTAFVPSPKILTDRMANTAIIPVTSPNKPLTRLAVSIRSNPENNWRRGDTSTETPPRNRNTLTTKHDENASLDLKLVGLAVWMTTLSAYILINQYVGPWPAFLLRNIPERFWYFGHLLGGMAFGGGILLTTCLETLVAQRGDASIGRFWFSQVPLLDMAIVVPGLTVAVVSGIALAVWRYGSLGTAPPHITYAFYALVAFAAWWASTDLTTQASALEAVQKLAVEEKRRLPGKAAMENAKAESTVLDQRFLSNVVSLGMVLVLYAIMVFKPGSVDYL